MDYAKYLVPSKYVISLDTFDLALLPTIHSSKYNNTHTATLWTTNNSNLYEKDFFEFEVKPKNDTTVLSVDQTIISNDTVVNHQSIPKLTQTGAIPITMCHICNIEVPTAYITDHENSLKHKAFVKIADIVLDRARKHMVKKSTGYVQKKNNTYFCGPCASEIHALDKHSHEKSKGHKQSVSLDRLLYELAALYTDEDNDNVEEPSSVLFDDDTSYLKTECDNNTVVVSDIRARLDEFEMKTIENFIKMIDECDIDKPYVLSNEGNNIRISMQGGFEVIVALDNFNGFMRIDNSFVLCIVCKMVVGDENAHKISDAHIKNIITPFKDHHCLRNLDNSSSHCVICNKIVNNSDLHVLCDETHNKLLQTALVHYESNIKKHDETESSGLNGLVKDSDLDNVRNDTAANRLLRSIMVNEVKSMPNDSKPNVNIINPVQIDDDTCYCPACNIKMHVNNIGTHINGTKHAMNSKSKLHYLMKQEEGCNDLLCRVCNTYVADDLNQIEEHVANNEHRNKYRDLLSTNNVIEQNDNFHCKPCDVVLLKRNELYHIEKLSHEIKLGEINGILSKNPTVTQNSTIKNTVNDDDSKLTNKNTAYYCNICCVYIPNNPNNISDHNNGARHTGNMCKIDTVTDSIEANSSIGENLDIHYQMVATDNEKTLMCKVCKAAVANRDDCVMEHIIGKKHRSSLQTIMDANNIELINEQYYCKICKLHIKTHNLFLHIDQTRHMSLLGNLEQKPEIPKLFATPNTPTKSNVLPEKEIVNANLNNVTNTETIDKLYLKFKHHFTETEDMIALQCKICFDIEIINTAEAVASHAATQTHLNEYKSLISDNLIFESEDQGYFCAICECLVPLKGEIHHIKGLRHKNNYTNISSEGRCKFCNMDISGVSTADHITSPDHVTTILKKQSLLHYCQFCKVLVKKDKAEEHAGNCHKLAVKDKICFCTICDPHLPDPKRN